MRSYVMSPKEPASLAQYISSIKNGEKKAIFCPRSYGSDLTWCCKLQAQTDTGQPLLDQLSGLTLLPVHLRLAREAKITRIAVSAAHDRLLLSIFKARDILLVGSFGNITYDRAHFLPQTDAARTDTCSFATVSTFV